MLEILYEDNHLLALNKPAGIATMGVEESLPSLAREAKHYLKLRYQKPGNVYLGIVSRLDSVSSGVVLFARTSKAAARLSEQFRSRHVQKTYWAIVEGRIEPAGDVCEDWLVKDESQQRMVTCQANFAGAQQARLTYRTLSVLGGNSVVEVDLETGRKHQIRVQLAERGYPIRGDRKYGARQKFAAGIALHARRLVVAHPVAKQDLELVAPLPQSWPKVQIPE
jgi:23S rRNA pseudouridine1911/1915/1917 synthase